VSVWISWSVEVGSLIVVSVRTWDRTISDLNDSNIIHNFTYIYLAQNLHAARRRGGSLSCLPPTAAAV